MIELNYVVTSSQSDVFAVQAIVGGVERTVTVPGVVLEMQSEDASMGHTYRFVPEDVAAALAAFPVGTSVLVSLTPVE